MFNAYMFNACIIGFVYRSDIKNKNNLFPKIIEISMFCFWLLFLGFV